MAVTTEEKTMEETMLNKEDLEYKIEIATQTLDRNICFVTNCDNKTSIALAVFGVLLAIILTNEGLGAIFVMVLGLFNLGSVLVAKTSEEAIGREDANSRIFFFWNKKKWLLQNLQSAIL